MTCLRFLLGLHEFVWVFTGFSTCYGRVVVFYGVFVRVSWLFKGGLEFGLGALSVEMRCTGGFPRATHRNLIGTSIIKLLGNQVSAMELHYQRLH